MQIACPECNFTKDVENDKVSESGAKCKCPKCGTIFHIEKPLDFVIDNNIKEKNDSSTKDNAQEYEKKIMHCTECGEVVQETDDFCGQCRTPINILDEPCITDNHFAKRSISTKKLKIKEFILIAAIVFPIIGSGVYYYNSTLPMSCGSESTKAGVLTLIKTNVIHFDKYGLENDVDLSLNNITRKSHDKDKNTCVGTLNIKFSEPIQNVLQQLYDQNIYIGSGLAYDLARISLKDNWDNSNKSVNVTFEYDCTKDTYITGGIGGVGLRVLEPILNIASIYKKTP